MKYSLLKSVLLVASLLWTTVLPIQAGWIKRYVYQNITGTAVTNLFGTNLSGVIVFPDTPDEAQLIPSSYFGPYAAESLSGYSDNYGSYLPGYVEPPETGNYVFWVCGDDETQLWLTTDAADPLNPAKKQLLASVPGWSNVREWTKYPEQQSASVYLEKGKQYYLEILHKDGTGGDHVGWGWQLPSGAIERPMQTFYLQPTYNSTDPIAVNGPYAVPMAPMSEGDSTIYDGMEVMLFADLNLTPPYTVEWRKNGAAITGANQTYYRFRARSSDNGALFLVRVNGVDYGPVVLSVTPDGMAPELVSATVPPNNPTQISLVFSEPITPATANDTSKYTLNAGTVQSAVLQPDGRSVLLKTSLLTAGTLHTLTINGIQDWALPVNTIAANTQTNLLIADGTISYRIWYSNSFLSAQSLAGVRTWSAVNSTAPTYVDQTFNEERIITTTSYQWSLLPLRNNFVAQMVGYLTAPETGNYMFGIASDDQSVLYLSTSEQPALKKEICYRDGSAGRWNLGVAASQRSAYIHLEAGKRYYLEAVYREGTGGDGVTVAWERPSDTAEGRLLPSANESVQANTEPFLIPARYLSAYVTFGSVFLKTDLPAALSVAESTRPTLSVVADGSRTYTYQWYKNGAAIPAAVAASYTLPYVRLADNNATFHVVVTNSFSSVTSAVTTLTVTADTAKPTVVAVGSLYKQAVQVQLSEPVTEATATDSANYLLLSSAGTPVAVTAALQDANDPTRITLQTAALPETDLMQLVVEDLVDLSPAANAMDPQTNTFRANNFDAVARINNSQAYGASAVGDQLTLTAGGADIWGNADQGTFLYKTLTGNFDYRVRGLTVPSVNTWTKLGLMVRPSTASGARNVFNAWTPVTPAQNQFIAQLRDTTAGASTSANDANTPLNAGLQGGQVGRPTVAVPHWLRIQRVGNTFYLYRSGDGANWTFWTWYDSETSPEGAMPDTVQVGIGFTSHDTGRIADAELASFSAVDDGALRFTLTPTNASVVEGGTAVFAAAVAGHSPWIFEWSKNGTPIPNGTNATLTLTMVPFSDNNATITCRVINPYGESVTANALLQVLEPDHTKPSVATVGSLFKYTVEVQFTEGVTTDSASTLANYTLLTSSGASVEIQSAVPDPENPAHVTLTTAALPETDWMRLACRNLVDLSLAANVMDPQTNGFRANNFDLLERINNTQNYAARAEGDQIIMTAGGSDIWGTADQFAYLYKTVTGDFDYKVQGVSLPPVNQWTKMGPMVRVGVAMGDRNNFSCFTPSAAPGQNTYSPQVRPESGAATISSDTAGGQLNVNLQSGVAQRPTVVYPSWLRLQRVGNNIYYYYSTTGTNWTFWTWYDSTTSGEGALPESLLVGLALTSHDSVQTVDGVMSSFSVVVEEPLQFVIEPISITVEEGGTARFTALATGRGPYTYQWLRDGADLVGATAAAYTIPNVPLSDNGTTFACRIGNLFGDSVTSSNALLTVVQDVNKPVAYAVGSLHGTGIGVYFSDLNRLEPVSATDPANYTVNGGAVTVTGATLERDNLAVMLSLSAPITGPFSVEIKNVSDAAPTTPNVMNTVTLQSTVVTWPVSQDVGTLNATPPPAFSDPLMPGYAQAIGTNGFYVHAGGHDIWDAADGLHFVHQPVTGDFDVAVQVAGLLRPNEWAKAGLMVREDLDAGSRNFLIAATPTDGMNLITVQWRLEKGLTTASIADGLRPRPSPIPNAWLRLARSGQVFTFYHGTNGTDWVSLYTTDLTATPYPATVHVGMATTSHNNGALVENTTDAYFRNLTGLPFSASAPATLNLGLSGNNVVISWTSAETGLQLQSTGSLLPVNWQPVITAPVADGDTYTVTIPLTAEPRFFRLVR